MRYINPRTLLFYTPIQQAGLPVRMVQRVSQWSQLLISVVNSFGPDQFFFYFLPSAEYIFIFDYLTVILPRRLLSTATARYSTHPLDVDL